MMKPFLAPCFLSLAAILLPATPSLFAQTTFSNMTSIAIVDDAAANPYPSTIDVSGLGPSVLSITVTINDLNHAFPDDVGLLLVGPTGVALRLMTDAGGGPNLVANIDLTFDDAAPLPVPDDGPLASGTFQPTQGVLSLMSGEHDANFAAPAPAGPYSNTLSSFNGTDPNGAWRLFVDDDTMFDGGSIDGGYSITITAVPESGTWAMMALGAGMLGAIHRFRRRQS